MRENEFDAEFEGSYKLPILDSPPSSDGETERLLNLMTFLGDTRKINSQIPKTFVERYGIYNYKEIFEGR